MVTPASTVSPVNLPGDDESFLDLGSVAAVFKVHPRTILREVKRNHFPTPTKIGRKRYWPRKSVLDHLHGQS